LNPGCPNDLYFEKHRLELTQPVFSVCASGVTILDRLIDFDAVLNDPSNPSHMLPQYLTDGIHPNNAGHQAMADAIDLNLFQ